MNDILQVILYFFEALDYEFPQLENLPFTIKELKDLNFPSSLALMKRLFPQLQEKDPDSVELEDYPIQAHHGARIFTPEESAIINKRCRGFIYFLENAGVLDSITREKVIEETLRLNSSDVTLSRLKWLTFAILSEQTDKIAAACVERLVLNIQPNDMH